MKGNLSRYNFELLVAEQAQSATVTAAQLALPLETGGILLGFRTPRRIVVTRALVVNDSDGGRTTYLRSHRQAEHILAAALIDASDIVGYVGEWHSHASPQPPSPTDVTALLGVARGTSGPVALLVFAFSGEQLAALHGHVASTPTRRLTRLPTARSRSATVTIIDEPSASLEHRATQHRASEGGR
jgi:Prokaryotic homologs of the JAB domain